MRPRIKYMLALAFLFFKINTYSQTFEQKRKESIKSIVIALAKNDSINLFKLVDTFSMKKLISRSEFNTRMKKLFNNFKNNNTVISDSEIIKIDNSEYTSEYRISIKIIGSDLVDKATLFISFRKGVTNKAIEVDVFWNEKYKIDDNPFKKISIKH